MAPHQAAKGQNWLGFRRELFGFGRELCGYLHLPIPAPGAILLHCHCFTVVIWFMGIESTDLLNQTFTYFCILKLFQLPSKIILFGSMNPPSYFPHLSVKPALINGGIQPGAARTSLCAQNHSRNSRRQIENLSVQKGLLHAKQTEGGPW